MKSYCARHLASGGARTMPRSAASERHRRACRADAHVGICNPHAFLCTRRFLRAGLTQTAIARYAFHQPVKRRAGSDPAQPGGALAYRFRIKMGRPAAIDVARRRQSLKVSATPVSRLSCSLSRSTVPRTTVCTLVRASAITPLGALHGLSQGPRMELRVQPPGKGPLGNLPRSRNARNTPGSRWRAPARNDALARSRTR